ncbi:MAG TPA: hypothetical protein VK859_05690, partial [bacterium]|nr:hypothetical protein [bacterium]
MKISVKYLWLGALLVWGFGLPTAAAGSSGGPLTFQVLGNGTVIINDGPQEVARVHLMIFTGEYANHYWEKTFTFAADNNIEKSSGTNTVLVNKVPVDLDYNVERLESGVHIHYHLAPRESIEVSRVEVYTSYPYKDWQGAPFAFNDNEAVIPNDPVPDTPDGNWVIREAQSSPLALGPSVTHSRLTFQMADEDLNLILADDRWYNRDLSIVLGHERSDSPSRWIWEKGQPKDFDFTLTYNRPMAPLFPSSLNPAVPEKAGPSSTPTITPTPLQDDCLDRVVDDFEDPARNGAPPARINRWGGQWNTLVSGGSINVVYNGEGAEGTRFCASASGENPLDSKGGDAVFQTLLFANGAPFNCVIHGLTGVQFYMKGDGNSYWFNVLSSAVTDVNGYSFNVVPPKGVWTFFRVPFSEMSLKSWWETEGGEATHPDGSDVTGIGFESKGRGSFAFSVDQIAFYGNPSNCPSPKVPEEPTLVPTPSPTPWPTRTFTPVPSNTPRPTSTPVPIPTETPLPTHWLLRVPTPTPNFSLLTSHFF